MSESEERFGLSHQDRESLRQGAPQLAKLLRNRDAHLADGLTWDRRVAAKLHEDARFCFECLCRSGADRRGLAAAVWIALHANKVKEQFIRRIGTKQRRVGVVSQLRSTASLMESLAVSVGLTGEAETAFTHSPQGNSTAFQFPFGVSRTLETYAFLVECIPKIGTFVGVRSPRDVERYIVAAYVKKATGSWHDCETSVLLSSIESRGPDRLYDESTHRMWRTRNFERIDKLGDILVDSIHTLASSMDSNEHF